MTTQTLTRPAVRTLDRMMPLSTVTFQVGDEPEEEAVFLGIEGEGLDRTAKFMQVSIYTGKPYTWTAYRYKGRWTSGTGAQVLRNIRAAHTFAPTANPAR
jgi:hypothetical protein